MLHLCTVIYVYLRGCLSPLTSHFADLDFTPNFFKENHKKTINRFTKQHTLFVPALKRLTSDRGGRVWPAGDAALTESAPSSGQWPGLQLYTLASAQRPGLQPWPLTPAGFSLGSALTDTPTGSGRGQWAGTAGGLHNDSAAALIHISFQLLYQTQ